MKSQVRHISRKHAAHLTHRRSEEKGTPANSCSCDTHVQHQRTKAARKFHWPQSFAPWLSRSKSSRSLHLGHPEHCQRLVLVSMSLGGAHALEDDEEECEWFPLLSLGTYGMSPGGIPMHSSSAWGRLPAPELKAVWRAGITVSNLFRDDFCDALLDGLRDADLQRPPMARSIRSRQAAVCGTPAAW